MKCMIIINVFLNNAMRIKTQLYHYNFHDLMLKLYESSQAYCLIKSVAKLICIIYQLQVSIFGIRKCGNVT